MKKFNSKTRKFLTAALFLTSGFTILSAPNPLNAQVCPDPSSITSPNDDGDATSFIEEADGACYATPEEYGVTIFRMGLCTSDPSPLAFGDAPDTSSCSFTFSKDDGIGEPKSFEAGGVVDLPEAYSSNPAVGDYPYAVIEIAPTFDIKAQYGPLGDADNTTYFTNGTFGESGTVTGATSSPPSTEYEATSAPLNTFYGDEGEDACVSTASENVDGGTISAYLLDSDGELIADDATEEECGDVAKLFAVMELNDDVNITASTTALQATFTVTDNGTTVIYDDVEDGLLFDSGPFSVTFETSE